MKNILKYKIQIERQNKNKALGYESTLDFNYGFISSLLTNDLINRKEFNILKDVYCVEKDNDYFSMIDNEGNLVKGTYKD